MVRSHTGPRMSQYVPDSEPPVLIERYEQLVEDFERACKPRDRWRVGTEYEKVAVDPGSGHAVPFSGPSGIEATLRELVQRFGWEPIMEDGRIIALRRGGASITLEPGGQIELSGEAFTSVHEAAQEFRQHVEEVTAVGDDLGFVILGLGMQPVSRLDEIEMVPKRRYRIMAPYMTRVGSLGLRMMKQTATVQVNLDFATEADAMAKMRVGMGIVPLVSAMFANSPFCDGDLNGYLTFRGHVWTDTDTGRSGLLRFVFEPTAGFPNYVDYALDVPMYFIIRDSWIDMTQYTFRRFLEDGCGAHRATMADWRAHLTTLFPEVRLKSYIELRAADAQLPDTSLALPALAKGIFYDDDALLAAWDLVKPWSWEERLTLYNDAHRGGLAARVRGIGLRDLCRELLAVAHYGLGRQRCLSPGGQDETFYLERLTELVRKGTCPAELLVERWKGDWKGEIPRMISGTAYTADSVRVAD